MNGEKHHDNRSTNHPDYLRNDDCNYHYWTQEVKKGKP